MISGIRLTWLYHLHSSTCFCAYQWMNLLLDYAYIGYIHYRSVLNFGQQISTANLSIFSACQWISTLNRWLERNAHKQRANVNGVGRNWNVGSLILVELPVWRNEDRPSESCTNVVKVATVTAAPLMLKSFTATCFGLWTGSHRQAGRVLKESYHVELFVARYYRQAIMQNSLSQGTKEKLSGRSPFLKVLQGRYQVELHVTRYSREAIR